MADSKDANEQHDGKPDRRLSKLLIVVAAALILVLVFMAGAHLGRFAGRGQVGLYREPGAFGGRMGMMHERGDYGFGGGMVNTSGNRITGVVTAVNGDSFTLAGNGSTETVQANSSTQYRNGNKPVVNDTVVVFGTSTNGTWTASQIVINP